MQAGRSVTIRSPVGTAFEADFIVGETVKCIQTIHPRIKGECLFEPSEMQKAV
jgi:hypothetical protein